VAALLLISCREATPAQAPERTKPELFLLTPLPLMWSEEFSLDQPGSPVLQQLRRDYQVTPIDLPSDLPAGALLLAAQPRALPPEELVALDEWVRAGGRLVLLADPMLEWPSDLPLGDLRRAPIGFADTGLLRHWGLQLDRPEQRGPVSAAIGGQPVQSASPGVLIASTRDCRVADAGMVARCRLGRGQAVVIADADFLNIGSGSGGDGNLAALESQLRSLGR
jgi:hypothetical protein